MTLLQLTLFLYIGHDLDATTSSSDDRNTLSFQRVPLFVRSGMHELALVVFQAGNIWHLPLVQDSSSIDEELCFVFDDSV
jgi:hypothetical protein